jgi:hypothetical protein
MPQTVQLPDDLAADLADEASRLGLSMPDYALRLLATRPAAVPPVRTGADLVAFWESEGLIGGRPDLGDSQAEARRIREAAQTR